MRYLTLLFAILALPPAATASTASGCASHWCMRLMGVGGSGYACMVGGEMGPNTCLATTSGCTRTACRVAVLAGPGGRVLAALRPRCEERAPALSSVRLDAGILPRLSRSGVSSPSADRLQDLEQQ